MNSPTSLLSRIWRKQYALPPEHGTWIWFLGPMLIGLAAGGRLQPPVLLLFLTGLAAFLLRQPTTIAVKVLSGRRTRTDLTPSLVWIGVYSLIVLLGVVGLVSQGYGMLLWLVVPGLPVFLWHLRLVSRRAERGNMDIEVVGAGALALAAPAAYWVAGGDRNDIAWILWGITWLQSSASIVHVYLRLAWCRRPETPSWAERLREGRRSALYHAFNLSIGAALTLMGLTNWLVPLAFALMLLDAAETMIRPPKSLKATRVGLRQLGASMAFVAVTALAFSIRRC